MSLPRWLSLFGRRARSRWSRPFEKPRRRHQCAGIVAAQIESCEPRIVLDAAAGAVARDAFAGDSDEGIFASFVSELAEVGQAINDVAVDALLSADEALDGALFAADSSLNTVIDLVDPVSDSIYGTLDAFVDTAVPLIDAGIDVIQTLADSSLFEDYVDELATAALGYVETAIAENPITVFIYTGDIDATPEMIAAAYDAAGMFYIGNAGLAHEALGGVDGELADSVATVLVWIEGEELHSMVVESTPDLPSGVVYLPGGPDDLPAEYLAGANLPPVRVIPANQAVLVNIRDHFRTLVAAAQLADDLQDPQETGDTNSMQTADGDYVGVDEFESRPDMQVRDTGIVYGLDGVTDGATTPTGLPYVGQTTDEEWRDALSSDGRARSGLEPLEWFLDPREGDEKERMWLDLFGGLEATDNKRLPPDPMRE